MAQGTTHINPANSLNPKVQVVYGPAVSVWSEFTKVTRGELTEGEKPWRTVTQGIRAPALSSGRKQVHIRPAPCTSGQVNQPP